MRTKLSQMKNYARQHPKRCIVGATTIVAAVYAAKVAREWNEFLNDDSLLDSAPAE